MSLFSAKKEFLIEVDKKLLSLKTGEYIYKKHIKNTIVIHLEVKGKGFVSQKKKPHLRFIYKTNKGDYIASNSLNIKFLYAVLKDLYNKKAFILTSKDAKKNILIFGEKIAIADKDDKDKIALFFQGITPKIVKLEDVVEILKPEKNKKLIIAFITVLAFFMLFYLNEALNSSDESNISHTFFHKHKKAFIYTKKIKKTAKTFNLLKKIHLKPYEYKILASNYFLQQVFSLPDLAYKSVWIQQIDFDNLRIVLGSLKVEPGFIKNGSLFYMKNIIFSLNKKDLKFYYLYFKDKEKSFNKCKKAIESINAISILGMTQQKNEILYQLKGSFSPEKTQKILHAILYCPIIIKGTITTDIKHLKENVNLNIKLLKIKGFGNEHK